MSTSTALAKTSPTQSLMKNDNKEDNKFHRVQLVTEEQPNGGTVRYRARRRVEVTVHCFFRHCWGEVGCLTNVTFAVTGRFKISDPAFQFSKATSPDISLHHNAFKEAHDDITTGVTRRSLTGVDGELAGNDTTWPATQVGPRTVKAGLGGHDDGASGGRRGCRKRIAPVIKTGIDGIVRMCHLQ